MDSDGTHAANGGVQKCASVGRVADELTQSISKSTPSATCNQTVASNGLNKPLATPSKKRESAEPAPDRELCNNAQAASTPSGTETTKRPRVNSPTDANGSKTKSSDELSLTGSCKDNAHSSTTDGQNCILQISRDSPWGMTLSNLLPANQSRIVLERSTLPCGGDVWSFLSSS